MTINTIPKGTIDRMTSKALSGDLNTAFAVLNQSGLTEGQKSKIAAILKEPRSDMEQRIVEVVGEDNISSADASSQSAPSEQVQCISFPDAPTSPFGNAFPCTFGFEGKHYLSATACILAQQYIIQPEIMDLFTNLNSEEAITLAEFTPVTKKRKRSSENPQAEQINRDDLLVNVLRAKFDQNPDLKTQLLATGGAYLVCQGQGLYLCDNFNGSGRNALGTCLMRLRGEYGGTGQVAPPAAYRIEIQSLLARSHFIGNVLYSDIIVRLFYTFASECDFKTVSAVACVNKHWNDCSKNFWAGVDLKDLTTLCPELTILDAKAQGVKCEDEPKINKFRLIKEIKEISPHVEGSAGVTYLTLAKGTTLKQLAAIAKGAGMNVEVGRSRISEELRDVPVEQTYGILITNSVLINSRDKDFNSQKILVEGHGCQMPTVQEYVALCVYTNKVFKKCLYGQDPWTFARSSTHVENCPLFVGGSAAARLRINYNTQSQACYLDDWYHGAGGRRKFENATS